MASKFSTENPIFFILMINCCMCFWSKQRKSYERIDAKHTINFKWPYAENNHSHLKPSSVHKLH